VYFKNSPSIGASCLSAACAGGFLQDLLSRDFSLSGVVDTAAAIVFHTGGANAV